jgi:predicted small metal-binding protein
MRKLALLTLLSVAVLVLAATVSASSPNRLHGANGTVWATERALGTAAAFDAATGELLWTAKVGASPIGIVQPHGTPWVYTSDEGSNRMSVLDRESGALVTTIPMGPLPHHLTASRNGDYVYVGEFGHNEIGVVDTATNTRIAGFVASPDPLARTHMPFVTRDGDDLYATNTRADRTQAPLRIETRPATVTPTGIGPSPFLSASFPASFSPSLTSPPSMERLLRCDCGFEVRAEDDAGLVACVQRHAFDAHGMRLTRDDVLQLAVRLDARAMTEQSPGDPKGGTT